MLRGDNVMTGYYRDPEATREAFRGGWFHTGDLGVMHPDGYVELRDRLKDIVISGGENIATIEVEQALVAHPSVAEAAVVGAPDEQWGEVPIAFVTARGGEEIDADELIAFARERLARFKVPKRIVVLEELPKTGTGKIQKFELRERGRGRLTARRPRRASTSGIPCRVSGGPGRSIEWRAFCRVARAAVPANVNDRVSFSRERRSRRRSTAALKGWVRAAAAPDNVERCGDFGWSLDVCARRGRKRRVAAARRTISTYAANVEVPPAGEVARDVLRLYAYTPQNVEAPPGSSPRSTFAAPTEPTPRCAVLTFAEAAAHATRQNDSPYSNARDFAPEGTPRRPRPSERPGRRVDHAGPGGAHAGGRRRPGIVDLHGGDRARDVERPSGRFPASARRAGSPGMATTMAWRRASTGTASASERTATGSSRSQRISTNARLDNSPPRGGTRRRSRSRPAAAPGRATRARRARAGAARRQRDAHLAVEGDRAAAVADRVGDERDRGHGVSAASRTVPRGRSSSAVAGNAAAAKAARVHEQDERGPARRGTGCSSGGRAAPWRAS